MPLNSRPRAQSDGKIARKTPLDGVSIYKFDVFF